MTIWKQTAIDALDNLARAETEIANLRATLGDMQNHLSETQVNKPATSAAKILKEIRANKKIDWNDRPGRAVIYNGIRYQSMSEAARALNLDRYWIRRNCMDGKSGWRFE